MRRFRFWLRWSWRDLRERWLLVAAIAATIAVGTGAYAGLSSSSAWRRAANDASFAALNMYDLRVHITDGSFVPAGRLATTARRLAGGSLFQQIEERLVVPTQVDASTADQTILVPGRLIGLPVGGTAPPINGVSVKRGRNLTAADAGKKVGILEYHFARHYDLPDQGTVKLPGNVTLDYVGQGLTPEYFIVINDGGALQAEANFAAIVAPLDTVQAITGQVGQVNDLLVRLAPGVDLATAEQRLKDSLASSFPRTQFKVMTAEDDQSYATMYQQIDSDQKFYSIFAIVIMLGATLAAFNLTSRIVEAQRRQIGISMALGVPPRWIAFRPILVGAQVALLGVALGVGVGLLVDAGMDSLVQRYFPLPVWSAPFQPGTFAQAGIIGFVLPFAACLYPVLRAVNVPPIEAIRTGFMSARGSGLAPLAGRLRIPGSSTAQMPIRNLLRTPRRTLLTALGIGAAVTVLVGTTGMTDTFQRTIDNGEREVVQGSPSRLFVSLAQFEPTQLVTARLQSLHVLATIEPEISLSTTAKINGRTLDLATQLINLDSQVWTPTIVSGHTASPLTAGQMPEIVLAQAGASELGVRPGDIIVLTHPLVNGLKVETVDTEVRVAGLEPTPLRTLSHMDLSAASLFGLQGRTNELSVVPKGDQTIESVQKKLFNEPGVTSVQSVTATSEIFRNLVDQYLSLLGIVQFTALALVLLIAFNSATIALDERSREHATMFAFGTRLRTVLALAIAESALVGLIGTIIGLIGGRIVIELIVRLILPDVVPNVGFSIVISVTTIAAAFVLGIAVVALAPLFGIRRLQNMDIPTALRVVE
ncbi:MAG TPA: FtsX-like permease family protein [Candidatus Saccharimonadales bacterium]|nr:FtsX-like permease family protein [Candidatus Saccharimonadales bacterium]